MAGLLTDERLLSWGRDLGIDLTKRDQLLDTAAVGLTIMCWRNTELENIHAGCERRDAVDGHIATLGDDADEVLVARLLEDYDLARHQFDAELYADRDALEGVADPAEHIRIERLLRGRQDGFGIPDDIMMRINIATVLAVRAELASTAADALIEPGAELGYHPDSVPDFVGSLVQVLEDPHREMAVGPATVAVIDLFGEARWDRYLEDLYRKVAVPIRFADIVGARRALWYAALSGVSYGSEWFPTPQWGRAVASIRDALRSGRLDDVVYAEGGWLPGVEDDAFWNALELEPNRLNGRQARWVIDSEFRRHLRAVREADRQRLGPLSDGRFNGLAAMS
jgi:hypothetical protein